MKPPRSSSLRRVAALAWCLTPLATPAAAQTLGWHGGAEANGTFLFGSASDRLAALNLDGSRADSTLEVRGDVRFGYGDGVRDGADRVVTARSVGVSVGMDYLPFGRYSPFWLGSFESSLQARVADRFSGGVGTKWTIRRVGDNEASVSVAALVERTQPLAPDTGAALPVTWRNRWSLRVKLEHRLSSAVTISHTTFFQPTIDRIGRSTATTVTSLETKLTGKLGLTLTLRDNYDSEARSRGARSNSDGQLLVGLRAGG